MDDWDFMFLIGEIHLIRGRMENLVNEFSILDFPTPEDITYGDDDEDTDQAIESVRRRCGPGAGQRRSSPDWNAVARRRR